MASNKERFSTLKSWFKKLKKLLKKAWKSFRKGLRKFIDAPLSWTWGKIKAGYRLLARFIRWLLMLPVRLFKAIAKWLGNLTGQRVWSVAWRFFAWGAVVLGLGLFGAIHWPGFQIHDVKTHEQVHYLDQGWGVGRESEDRQTFYYTGQGAGHGNALKDMRYDWFVNLELPWGKGPEKLFRNPLHMLSYGFQVDNEPTTVNPYNLPVGFARHWDPVLKDYVLDITCATCHTGNLQVEKDDGTTVSIRIDGGQGMHAFTAANMPHFVPVLLASMTSTLVNPVKFNRFALNVLGKDHYKEGKAALRREFKKTFNRLLKMGYVEKSKGLVTVQEGFARTDALTRIANAVFGDHITPDNYKDVDAPVNYPPLWDIWKFDWVQYSASVAQPMARNLGESLGVGTRFNFVDEYGRPVPEWNRYDVSARMHDLHKLEETLRELQPPVWREDLLGEIDMKKAVDGGIAFIRTCQGCHGPHPASHRQIMIEAPLKLETDPPSPHWKMKTLTTSEIGTDATAAKNFVRRTFDLTKTGLSIGEVAEVVGAELNQKYQRVLAYDFPEVNSTCAAENREVAEGICDAWDAARKEYDREMAETLNTVDLSAVTNGVGLWLYGLKMKQKMYAELLKQKGFTEDDVQIYNGFGALDLPVVNMVYKARPLGGMWATAPFLHNGSVRNLYQLLSPQHERDLEFYVGRPLFDTVNVGLKKTDKESGGTLLDTSIVGNANTGHEFRAGYTEWKKGNPPQFGVIGPAYTREQRFEIIEYMKVHLDDPPLSGLYSRVFEGTEEVEGIVDKILASMPEPGNEMEIAASWPSGQACNLEEYLGNHSGVSAGLNEELQTDIATIQVRLDGYFEEYFRLNETYPCGGKTRYQRGGEDYEG